MRALCIREFGGIDKLKLEDLPKPTPGPGQALIRVKSAALNRLDIWVRRGRPGLTINEAHVMGSDAAGVVEAFGPGCEMANVKVGQEVIVHPGVSCMKCEYCLRGDQSECAAFKLIGFQLTGVYAEYAVVPAVNLFPKPVEFSWEEAAALPLSHLTAFHMLFDRVKLQSGETVLIHGIGGGVALAALQMICAAGGFAIVTSSTPEKLEFAADVAKDRAVAGFQYGPNVDIAKKVLAATNGRGVDVVFDTVGAATLTTSMAAVRRGGRIVTCGVTGGADAQISMRNLYWNHISLLGSTMGSMEDMRRMLRMVEYARIKPVICRTFRLEEGVAATELLENGQQRGKIVLNV